MLAKEVCAIFNREQYFLEDACMVGIHWNGFFAFSLLAGKATCWNWTSRSASMIRSEIQQRPMEEYCVVGLSWRFITPGSFVFWCYPYQSVTQWHFPFRISPLQSAFLNQHIFCASWSLPCLVWSKLWVSMALGVWRGASAEAGFPVCLGGGSDNFLAHHAGCWKWSLTLQRSVGLGVCSLYCCCWHIHVCPCAACSLVEEGRPRLGVIGLLFFLLACKRRRVNCQVVQNIP